MRNIVIAANTPVVTEQVKKRQDASAKKEQKQETSLSDFYSAMLGSITAPGFSTPRVGADFTLIPARPALRTTPIIQRCSKGDSTCSCPECSKNAESSGGDSAGNEEMSLQQSSTEEQMTEQPVEQSPVEEQSPASMETSDVSKEAPVSEEQSSTALIADDNANELSEGQMKKTDFMQQLRSGISGAIGPILATAGQTTDGSAYLNNWLDQYHQKDASEIESAVKKYAPGNGTVRTAKDYISPSVQRTIHPAKIWARNRRLSGISKRLSTKVPDQSPAPASSGQGPIGASTIQFKAKEGGTKKIDDPLVIQTELGNGQPLEGTVRSRMESAFGMNFSHVRAHTDANAGKLSNRVNARAFTVGNHVAFGSGEYKPGTMLGDALIAHELAHTIQQSGAGASVDKMEVGNTEYDSLEKDADHAAFGAIKSLWGAKVGSQNVAQRSFTNLRSGLRLQRAGTTPDGVPLGPTDTKKAFCLKSCSFYSTNGKYKNEAQAAQEIVFEGENTGDDDGKACSCDCGIYRHWIKGYIRDGSPYAPKQYNILSCNHPITINETSYTEEYTSCLGDNASDACKFNYRDGPGYTGPIPLSNGKYIEIHNEFKYEIWDQCQGKSVDTHEKTLDISGDTAPRSIVWT